MMIEVYSALVTSLHLVAPGGVVEINEELYLVANDDELSFEKGCDILCVRLADGWAEYIDKDEQVKVMRDVKLTCSK